MCAYACPYTWSPVFACTCTHTTQLGDISQQAGALAEATEGSSSFSSLDFTIATTIMTSLADSALATNQLEVCIQSRCCSLQNLEFRHSVVISSSMLRPQDSCCYSTKTIFHIHIPLLTPVPRVVLMQFQENFTRSFNNLLDTETETLVESQEQSQAPSR